jgi:probable metal-binding protein
MSESIHGHEVMRMMVASGSTYTHDSLVAAIRARFGREARFHTCSAEDLTAEQLVDFLQGRGKFVTGQEGFTTQQDLICDD